MIACLPGALARFRLRWAALFLLAPISVWAGPDEPASVPAPPVTPTPDTVMKSYFGRIPHGPPVTLYTLTNTSRMTVSIMDYGATITSIRVPDRHGKMDDVVLGFDHLAPYLTTKDYFGATIGRYANRIAKGSFMLEKSKCQVTCNDGPNSLHGGAEGFNRQMWSVEPVESDSPAIRFTYFSKDGEEGYPGNLYVSVTFTLTEDNQLRLTYEATTDKTTVLNLTNHSYFNLKGTNGGTILDEIVTIDANKFTPVDDTSIPIGTISDVAGTAYDFRQPTTVGAHLRELTNKPQGYDINYVLNKGFFSNTAPAATVEDNSTGRRMDVSTDQPGLQFYTANLLPGTSMGRDHKRIPQYGGLTLETQHYPDSPNHANFPSTVLRPGDTSKSTTVFAFSAK